MTTQYIYIFTLTDQTQPLSTAPSRFKPTNTNPPTARSPKVVPRSLGKKWPSCPGSARPGLLMSNHDMGGNRNPKKKKQLVSG